MASPNSMDSHARPESDVASNVPTENPTGKSSLFERDFGGTGFVVETSDLPDMKTMPGFRAGTSVIAGIKRKAEDPDPIIDIPSELMEPLNCKLCEIMLNSPPQAQAHYHGKNHHKKARQYMAQRSLTPPKVPTLQPPIGTPRVVVEPTEVNTGTDSKSSEYCQLCNISFTSVVHAKSHYEGKNHAKRIRNQAPVYSKNAYYCCLCNLSLNSESQYDQHITSKKHANAMKRKDGGAEMSMVTEEDVDPQNGQGTLPGFVRPQESAAPTVPAAPVAPVDSVITPNQNEAPVMSPNAYYCSVCKLTVNSETQFNQHISSKKHANTVKRKEGGTDDPMVTQQAVDPLNGQGTLPGFVRPQEPAAPIDSPITANQNEASVYSKAGYYCSVCNVNVNSETQYNQHMSSKKHANAVKRKEGVADDPMATQQAVDPQNGQGVLPGFVRPL